MKSTTPSTDELLRRSELFRFLPEESFDDVAELFSLRSFDFGEVIVRQGQESDAYYVLVSGRARVVRKSDDGQDIALDTLRPGDEFGEQGLINSCPRNATVRCSSAVEALRLRRDDFQRLLEKNHDVKRSIERLDRFRVLRAFLYAQSNFSRLPERVLQALIDKLEPCRFQEGDSIIREGDKAGPMYIVREGRARAYVSVDGRTINRAFYRSGDFFGEASIMRNTVRAASVEAVSDLQLFALAPAELRELEEQHTEFRALLEERRAQYEDAAAARVPLDFADEMPAEARVADKTEGAADGPVDDEAGGFFRASRRRIRRVPHVQQIDEMDCGAACLGMVCRHYGRKVSLAHIRELCHTSRDGTSLKGICHAANEVGLAARALKVSRSNLSRMPLPAIVHWEGNHWTVLCDVSEKHVRVQDPAFGAKRMSRSEFEKGWTGYSALFDYTDALRDAPVSASMAARFAPFFRRHAPVLSQILLLALVVTFLQLLFPVLTQVVVDRVIVDNDRSLLVAVLIAMAAAIVFTQIASLLQEYLVSFSAIRLDASLLDFLTRELLSLPMSYFHSRRTGDIQRRLDSAEQVRNFALQYGVGGLLALITMVGTIAVMLIYSLALATVFLATMPLYGLLMWWSRKVLRPLFADIEECQGKYASHQIDAIKGIEAVKAASAEAGFRDAILNEFLGVAQKMFRANFILMSYNGLLRTIGLLATALFLWVGATRVMAGELTVGAFVAFSSLTAIAYAAILSVIGLWDQWQLISVLLNRLNDIFEPEPEQGRDRSKLRAVTTLEGRIALNDVGFRYGGPEAPEILKDLNLDFPPGKTTAIVGRSGSGKTTLIKLLAGLIEPTSGTIHLDHADLKSLNYRDVRRQIGMVLQENHIFSESIASNIAFGHYEPDQERIERAARTANAHEFILNLPLGYDTKIGESGLALSGGQKQRIAIARALYGDPPILIFDEATSALDSESERAIQSNLASMMEGRTCVVIAHRLSTIRDADRIVVLEQGRIAETGSHDELMALRGLYFHLSSQQLGI